MAFGHLHNLHSLDFYVYVLNRSTIQDNLCSKVKFKVRLLYD